MKLAEVVEIKLGMNLSRYKEKEVLRIYSNDDLLADLNGISYLSAITDVPVTVEEPWSHRVKEGDIVYSFINSVAGLVSAYNSGKIINQNFAKIIIDSAKIDSRYLCYLLNADAAFKKQKTLLMQGTTLRKLSPTIIRNFDVDLPHVEQQRLIGSSYLNWLKRQALAKKQLDLEDTVFMTFLDKLNTTNIEK